MKKWMLLFIVNAAMYQINFAQNTDKLAAVAKDTTAPKILSDSQATVKRGLFGLRKMARHRADSSFPVPKKAVLWSILPGGGQIYNRKLWYIKLPIVYGGFAGGVYAVNWNTQQYRFLKEQYKLKVTKQPLDPSISSQVTEQALKQGRDAAFKQLQQSYIFCGVWYIITAAEAFTTAHLAHFDVSDDLSFRLKPSFETLPLAGNMAGLGVHINF